MAWALRKPIAEPVRQPVLKAVARPTPSPTPRPRRRAKSLTVYRLYPASEPEPYRQAETLLHAIQRDAEDAVGKYVPARDLERLYGELCEREHWNPHHWSVMGFELGKLCERVCKKARGRRFNCYRIPRPI